MVFLLHSFDEAVALAVSFEPPLCGAKKLEIDFKLIK